MSFELDELRNAQYLYEQSFQHVVTRSLRNITAVLSELDSRMQTLESQNVTRQQHSEVTILLGEVSSLKTNVTSLQARIDGCGWLSEGELGFQPTTVSSQTTPQGDQDDPPF